MVKYRFTLDGRIVRPNYSDKMTLDRAREGEYIFFRSKLSEPMKFLRSDYLYIMGEDLAHKFVFKIEESLDFGATWWPFYEGFFYKTDCEFDLDHLIITAEIKTQDQYTAILDGLEREEDVIKMAVARTPVKLDKRPIIQIYIPGDDVITSIVGGSYGEQAANSSLDNEHIEGHFKFSLSNMLREIRLTAVTAPINVDGVYVGETNYDSSHGDYRFNGNLTNPENPDFYIHIEQVFFTSGNNSTIGIELFRTSDNIPLYRYLGNVISDGYETFDFVMNSLGVPGWAGTINAGQVTYRFYTRYMLDVSNFNGTPTWPIPNDDISGENNNYRYLYSYPVNNTGKISYRLSDEPTVWGMNPDGKYYLPPEDDPNFFPVARSRWGYTSIWFLNSALNQLVEPFGRKEYTMRDTHLLSDVIRALVHKIDVGYSHDATIAYSKFLYGTNPVSGTNYRNLITPKSNALLGEYDRPAEKAPITLKQIFDMLRDVCKLHWFVDEDMNLHIEHISYFRKGGAYSDNHVITVDLTSEFVTLTGQKLAKLKNKYKYRKDRMPERVQFNWVDDVSSGFAGVPILIKSPFVDTGKIEQVSVGVFNPDLDFMLLNPDGASKDGFALFGANNEAGGYRVPYVAMSVDGVDVDLQNGFWSFPWIQENYYGYNLPPGEVEINGNVYPDLPVPMRMIEQTEVKYPTIGQITELGLVKTFLGDGEIEKMSLNLHSRTYSIDLNHAG